MLKLNGISKYEKIVIGCSVESLLYSYFKNIPFIYCQKLIPNEFDFFSSSDNISAFYFNFEHKKIISPTSEEILQPTKLSLFNILYFFLSMNGLSLMPAECSSLVIKDKICKAMINNAKLVKFEFDKAIIFDEFNVFGLNDFTKNENNNFIVFDQLKYKNIDKIEYDFIETNDNEFVKKVLFLEDNRCVSISYIKEENLKDYEYSDINARFKVQHYIRKLLKKEEIEVETVERCALRQEREHIYKDFKNVKFNYTTVGQMLKKYKNSKLREKYIKYFDVNSVSVHKLFRQPLNG